MQKDPFESATQVEDYAIYESGLCADGCIEQLDQYAREAILRYGRILIEKYKLSLIEYKPKTDMAEIELDMEDWSKDMLMALVKQSCERDVSVNVIISDLLAAYVEQFKGNIDEQNRLLSQTEEKAVE